MIKWRTYLRQKSPSAYELLRKSKSIELPSQRTLRSYTHHYNSSSGFSLDFDKQLLQEVNSRCPEPYQRSVLLLGDKIHIREGLLYNESW